MKLLQKIFFITMAYVFVSNTDVHGVAVLDLPANTPGLQSSKQPKKICGITKECLHVIVPHSEAYKTISSKKTSGKQFKKHQLKKAIQEALLDEGNICFPINGHQPTTAEAAQYSCANVVSDHVTDWYIRAFGGNAGLELSYGRAAPVADPAPQMGFAAAAAPAHIITVDTTVAGTPANFNRDFWQTFRTIASDPVGRVLLYRILIEIRRHDAGGIGRCEMMLAVLHNRNDCRSITVNYDPDIGLVIGQGIDFHFNIVQTALLHIRLNRIFTEDMDRTPDIALFHEITHWFHYLRNPIRYNNDKIEDPYQYLTRCYYGNISELFTWEKDDIKINNEEIRTILGTPNYAIQNIRNLMHANAFFNIAAHDREQVSDVVAGLVANHFVLSAQKFLNGDDLSENAYRVSRHDNPVGTNVRMRWGHGDVIASLSVNAAANYSINDANDIFSNNRFRLANLVANRCYEDITNAAKQWRLGHEATEP